MKPKFHIISDLHFDVYRSGSKVLHDENYKENAINFINNIKELYPNKNDYVVLPGDFFNDYQDTLWFFKKLEENMVNSIVILGNHDYWCQRSLQKKTYSEIRTLFSTETKNFKYCHYLQTGKSFKIDEVTVIGDTAFTSLKDKSNCYRNQNDPEYAVERSKFLMAFEDPFSYLEEIDSEIFNNLYNLPDASYVKDWTVDEVFEYFYDFYEFYEKTAKNYNTILESNYSYLGVGSLRKIKDQMLLVVTHWPFESLEPFERVNPSDLWFKADSISYTKPREPFGSRIWYASGHTHKNKNKLNQISNQLGYNELQKLSYKSFTHLIPETNNSEISTYTPQIINNLFETAVDTSTINSVCPETIETINRIKKFGYSRLGNNDFKNALKFYLSNPKKYLDYCKNNLKSLSTAYGGYINENLLNSNTEYNKLRYSITILENKDNTSNPFLFYAAFIISSYLYSGKSTILEYMRPVNIYDLLRAGILFETINVLKIDPQKIETLNGSLRKNQELNFQNVNIKIVKINNTYELKAEHFKDIVEQLNNFIKLNNSSKQLKDLRVETSDEIKNKKELRYFEDYIINKNPNRLEYTTETKLIN